MGGSTFVSYPRQCFRPVFYFFLQFFRQLIASRTFDLRLEISPAYQSIKISHHFCLGPNHHVRWVSALGRSPRLAAGSQDRQTRTSRFEGSEVQRKSEWQHPHEKKTHVRTTTNRNGKNYETRYCVVYAATYRGLPCAHYSLFEFPLCVLDAGLPKWQLIQKLVADIAQVSLT